MPLSRHDHYPRADQSRCARMRRAAAALAAAWQRADQAPDGLSTALDSCADAPADAAIAALLPWLTDLGWLRARLGEALALSAADGFARPPLRLLGGGGGPAGLLLAERGALRLSLRLHPFETRTAPPTALFVPGHSALRVLRPGGAQLRLHQVAVSPAEQAGGFTSATAAPCHSHPPRPLVADEILHLDTARQSFTLAGGDGDILLLELTVQPPTPLPIRAYAIASGRLIHVAASRRDSSFGQMALALLSAMQRRDAAPLFIAEAKSQDFASRWHAMRALVALDPAAAQRPLAAMANADPHPEVRRAAAATLALFSQEKDPPCRTQLTRPPAPSSASKKSPRGSTRAASTSAIPPASPTPRTCSPG